MVLDQHKFGIFTFLVNWSDAQINEKQIELMLDTLSNITIE